MSYDNLDFDEKAGRLCEIISGNVIPGGELWDEFYAIATEFAEESKGILHGEIGAYAHWLSKNLDATGGQEPDAEMWKVIEDDACGLICELDENDCLYPWVGENWGHIFT